jgi:hypothetical protein
VVIRAAVGGDYLDELLGQVLAKVENAKAEDALALDLANGALELIRERELDVFGYLEHEAEHAKRGRRPWRATVWAQKASAEGVALGLPLLLAVSARDSFFRVQIAGSLRVAHDPDFAGIDERILALLDHPEDGNPEFAKLLLDPTFNAIRWNTFAALSQGVLETDRRTKPRRESPSLGGSLDTSENARERLASYARQEEKLWLEADHVVVPYAVRVGMTRYLTRSVGNGRAGDFRVCLACGLLDTAKQAQNGGRSTWTCRPCLRAGRHKWSEHPRTVAPSGPGLVWLKCANVGCAEPPFEGPAQKLYCSARCAYLARRARLAVSTD